jgi:hypothetical protein
MRPRLLHPTRERSERRGHERHAPQRRAEPRVIVMDIDPSASAVPSQACDPAAERVREAGGPIDEAVYTCACGYLFSAAVSTTVACPHCGTAQAW